MVGGGDDTLDSSTVGRELGLTAVRDVAHLGGPGLALVLGLVEGVEVREDIDFLKQGTQESSHIIIIIIKGKREREGENHWRQK